MPYLRPARGRARQARLALVLVALVSSVTACASRPSATPIVRPNPATTSLVEATRVDGGLRLQGVAGQILADGDLLIAGGSYRLIVYRSNNEGISFQPLRAPEVAALTPDIALVDERPLIAYTAFEIVDGERRHTGVRVLHARDPKGRWFDKTPSLVADIGVDPHLLPLASGRVLCFVVIDDTSLGVFASDDGGFAWFPLAEPLRNADARLEDGKAVVLDDGTILYAYEREPAENEASSIELLRSTDGGLTWSPPATLWHPDVAADVEPGGFVRHPDGALLFFLSSDEDPAHVGTSYAGARVRALVSHDDGRTWTMKGPVVEEADQIVFHAFPRRDGGLGLLTIRHWQAEHRALAVYHLETDDLARLVAVP